LQELYDDPGFDPLKTFRGNADLESVIVDTMEFGLEGRFSHRHTDFRLQAVFFYSLVKDSIESPDTGAGLPQYDNIEALDILGTEVEGVARFGERSRLFVNTSWFRSESSFTGEQDSSYITDVPQLRFNLGFDLAVFSSVTGASAGTTCAGSWRCCAPSAFRPTRWSGPGFPPSRYCSTTWPCFSRPRTFSITTCAIRSPARIGCRA
jgi:outer membrane receptor protein involved in Fe transport